MSEFRNKNYRNRATFQGRNGSWWRYDPRTELLIEDAFGKKLNKTEVTTVGQPYVIDLDRMVSL